MKKNEIKERLERAISEAPIDCFASIQDTPIRKMTKHDDITRQDNEKTKSPLLRPVALGASIMLLMLITIGGWHQFTMVPDSRVYFDVNPGVEIVMNRREKVIDLIGINAEGESLVKGVDFDGKDLYTVQKQLLEEMVENGLLEGFRQIMLVSAMHRDTTESQRLAREFDQGIHQFFENREMELVVFRQTLVRSNTLEEFAKTYNVSIGKMNFIRNLMILNPDLELEYLVERSLEELLIISMQTGLDLERIIDTDDDYQEFQLPERENSEEEPQPQSQPQPELQLTKRLSVAEIQRIALEETGGGVVVELKYDEGDREYEIIIFHNGYEYELEIDSVTGRIKDMDVDELDEDDKDDHEQSQDQLISIEQAKEIALSRTGGGYVEEIELDEEDGRWIYEIEAIYNGEEYELDIDAYTGNILSFERDD